MRVPKENLVGPLNGGWPITQGSLAHERAMLWIDYAYDVQRAVRALVELGDRPVPGGGRLGDDPRYRDAVAGFHIDAQALLAMGYRGFSKFLRGKASPEHSLLKLFGSESLQRAALGSEALGSTARPRSSARRCGARPWATRTCARSAARSRGTSEIQRNIIAERCSAPALNRSAALHAAFAGAQHAELVAFGVGEHGPVDVALADVDLRAEPTIVRSRRRGRRDRGRCAGGS